MGFFGEGLTIKKSTSIGVAPAKSSASPSKSEKRKKSASKQRQASKSPKKSSKNEINADPKSPPTSKRARKSSKKAQKTVADDVPMEEPEEKKNDKSPMMPKSPASRSPNKVAPADSKKVMPSLDLEDDEELVRRQKSRPTKIDEDEVMESPSKKISS